MNYHYLSIYLYLYLSIYIYIYIYTDRYMIVYPRETPPHTRTARAQPQRHTAAGTAAPTTADTGNTVPQRADDRYTVSHNLLFRTSSRPRARRMSSRYLSIYIYLYQSIYIYIYRHIDIYIPASPFAYSRNISVSIYLYLYLSI